MLIISVGKGMTSAERALLNAPRQSSLSSQMAAITAAADRDDSPSPPSGSGSKGKLDQMKMETEIKQEDVDNEMQHDTSDGGYGGKNIKSEMNSIDIKQEIKSEPMEENGVTIKEEPGLMKNEPGNEGSSDIKPAVDSASVGSGERKHKGELIGNMSH